MTKKISKIVLTERDLRTISQNNNICTDSHGKGCSVLIPVSKLGYLN